MKFFLDTADLDEIKEAASWGALAGVTTNPSLYARIGGKLDDFHNHIKRICDIVGPECPVSAESVAMTRDEIVRAIGTIKEELRERKKEFLDEGKFVEAQRLEQRTLFDLEMLDQVGFCKGIENYSRHLTGLAPGVAPPCLIDYLPSDCLMFFDESHVMMGQLGGMYRGDR